MSSSKVIYLIIAVVSFVVLTTNDTFSQCAMCRATVESNVASPDPGIGKSLNPGILYLMAFPYMALMAIGYFWYKNSKKDTAQRENVSEVLKRSL